MICAVLRPVVSRSGPEITGMTFDTNLILALLAALALVLILWLRRQRKPRKWIVIDGSNVMYWNGNTPDIATLQDVLRHLKTQGYTAGVVFDANAGYLLAGRYQHDYAFGKRLGLPQDRVMVVPKGTPADPVILQAARDLGGPILTNDKFRDWSDAFPEVRKAGHLIKGGYTSGALWIDAPSEAAA